MNRLRDSPFVEISVNNLAGLDGLSVCVLAGPTPYKKIDSRALWLSPHQTPPSAETLCACPHRTPLSAEKVSRGVDLIPIPPVADSLSEISTNAIWAPPELPYH